jgi:hypothetical protein
MFDKVVAYGIKTHVIEIIPPYPEAIDQTNQYRVAHWGGYLWEHELIKIEDENIEEDE